MNSSQRDSLYDKITKLLCKPLFYVKIRHTSVSSTQGNCDEEYVVQVTIGIRPMSLSDYKRSMLVDLDNDCKFLLSSFTEDEIHTVTMLVYKITDELSLPRFELPLFRPTAHSLVFQFK